MGNLDPFNGFTNVHSIHHMPLTLGSNTKVRSNLCLHDSSKADLIRLPLQHYLPEAPIHLTLIRSLQKPHLQLINIHPTALLASPLGGSQTSLTPLR